ncbi:MAG: hypothetical protein M3256_23515, partial [Actinomycetota bacterium]|nr:hypothetical protein [Actinomycetota bacterium]
MLSQMVRDSGRKRSDPTVASRRAREKVLLRTRFTRNMVPKKQSCRDAAAGDYHAGSCTHIDVRALGYSLCTPGSPSTLSSFRGRG